MSTDEAISDVLRGLGREVDDSLMELFRPFYVAGYSAGHRDGVAEGFDSAVAIVQDKLSTVSLARPSDVPALPLDTPLEDLQLSVRAYNCLYREINRAGSDRKPTISDVLGLTDDNLMDIRNFGPACLKELDAKLAAAGHRRGELVS